VVLQSDSEKGLSELGLDSVEESLLLNGLDCVDRAEGQSKETVGFGILSES
jgi:hypothetical protein